MREACQSSPKSYVIVLLNKNISIHIWKVELSLKCVKIIVITLTKPSHHPHHNTRKNRLIPSQDHHGSQTHGQRR